MLSRKYLSQIEGMKADVVSHQAEVSRHRNRVQSLIEESNHQREELDNRENRISELTYQADILDAEVKDRGTQISNISAELDERATENSRHLATLVERQTEISSLTTSLSEYRATVEEFKSTITEWETERRRLLAALADKETDNAKLSAELSSMSNLLDASNTRLRQIETDLGDAMKKSDEVTRQHRLAIKELAVQRDHAAASAPQRTRAAFTPAEAQQALHQSFKPGQAVESPTGDRADILMARPNPSRYNFDAPFPQPGPEQVPIDPDSDIARMMNAARRSMRQGQEQSDTKPATQSAVANVVAIAQRLRAQKDE